MAEVTAILLRLLTVQRRHGDADIRVPVSGWAWDVAVVSVVAEVLAGASGQVMALVEAPVEALASVELTPQGEAGSVMRSWSRGYVAMILYAIRKKYKGGIHYARI